MRAELIAGQQLDFSDLLLNPSVRREDEARLSRQAERMPNLFLEARDAGRQRDHYLPDLFFLTDSRNR